LKNKGSYDVSVSVEAEDLLPGIGDQEHRGYFLIKNTAVIFVGAPCRREAFDLPAVGADLIRDVLKSTPQ
jgi:hypothetical protein